jgi:hypothetical protein
LASLKSFENEEKLPSGVKFSYLAKARLNSRNQRVELAERAEMFAASSNKTGTIRSNASVDSNDGQIKPAKTTKDILHEINHLTNAI